MSDAYRQSGTVEKEDPQPFPLERILTVSALDYCESVGKKLNDYEMRGVHVIQVNSQDNRPSYKVFADKVPSTAEVVVGYTMGIARFGGYVSGTALIPKPK